MVASEKSTRKGCFEHFTGFPQEIFFMHRTLPCYPRFPPLRFFLTHIIRSLGATAALSLMLGSIAARPAPAQSFFGGAAIDGIRCDRMEGAVEHIHAHLGLFDRGRGVEVPAGIGIPNGSNCLYWVHTHRSDGFIHIESPARRAFTLGQFYDVWGFTLSSTQAGGVRASRGHTLRVWVNGTLWRGDPRAIVLRDRQSIVIQAGPPFARPRRVDWSSV